MARNVVATTAKAMTKAARATGAGATRMTVTTGATGATAATAAATTPNGDKDNEDGSSKNNDKATTTPSSTTEGGERCQSRRDYRGRGHHRPRDAAIELTTASSRHAFVGSCCFQV